MLGRGSAYGKHEKEPGKWLEKEKWEKHKKQPQRLQKRLVAGALAVGVHGLLDDWLCRNREGGGENLYADRGKPVPGRRYVY